jgi:hypothetical protein
LKLIKRNALPNLPLLLPGFKEFEFDLPKALLNEIIEVLGHMEASILHAGAASNIPEAQGVYQLFHDDELVYIGKTDAEAGLRTRLSRHASKIRDRPNLTGRVSFKSVRILVFTAMDLETQLIKHYRTVGAVTWNGSGFGSNDPGRERETTNKKPDGFDASYPISIDEPLIIDSLPPGVTVTVAAGLAAMKAALPYTLRYETLRNGNGRAMRGHPHADLALTSFTVPAAPLTTRALMRAIVTSLGAGWQATTFDSHVIVYKESRIYNYGRVI